MMAAHKNAVVIANIRQNNLPLVVPTSVGRLILFDTWINNKARGVGPYYGDWCCRADQWEHPASHRGLGLARSPTRLQCTRLPQLPLYNHRLERTGCHSIFSRSFFFHWFWCHQNIKLHSFEKVVKKLFGKNDWRAKQGVPSPSEPSRERSRERRNNSPSKSNQPPRQWQIWFDCSWLSESDEGSIE